MRRKCLLLMQVHIEEQLCRVRRRGEALRRRMVRRENRIRVCGLMRTLSIYTVNNCMSDVLMC